MKRILLLGLILCSWLTGSISSSDAKEVPVKVLLDNGTQILEKKLYVFKKEYFLDVSDLADFIDADLKWLPVSKKVVLSCRGNRIEFFFGNNIIVLNGQKLKTRIANRLEKGDLFVPLSFITGSPFSNALRQAIGWNNKNRTLRFQDIPNIKGLKVLHKGNTYRLSLELNDKLFYEVVTENENELTIEIYKGVLDLGNIPHIEGGSFITGASFEQEKNKVVWKLGFGSGCDYKTVSAENPSRIVVEVVKKEEVVLPSEPAVSSSSATVVTLPRLPDLTTQVVSLPVPATETARQIPIPDEIVIPKRIGTIVIDAGHGGKDPGAIGPYGTKEKDINLDIAFELAQILREKTDMKVILTRKEDVFIPLYERTNIANNKKADIFVSIHCNSGLGKDAKGFEIYFLSDRASDLEAEAVANIENSVIDMEDNSAVNDKLKSILWSLTLNEFVNDSSQLCSLVVDQVNGQNFDLTNRGVKQAGFFVLRGAKMPAILVECAFLSNKKEEKLLNRRNFREKMSRSIYNGIKEYINRKNAVVTK